VARARKNNPSRESRERSSAGASREEDAIMMTLWNPFEELMNDAFFGNRRPAMPQAHTPAVDVREEKNAYLIDIELPGFKAENVDVKVDNRVLIVTAERKSETDEGRKGYHRVERRFGKFQRSFTLPESVDAEHIEAGLRDGVLSVTVPKRETAVPRRIEVKGETFVDKAKKVLGGEKAA
jgi:HSP20 family protein